MCEFCDSIDDRDKEIIWEVKSTYADHNICEFVNDSTCSACGGCKMYFTLNGHKYKDDIYVSVEYKQTLKSIEGEEVIISPFSEGIQFNFCPICGKQISQNIKEWDKYHGHQITIDDND